MLVDNKSGASFDCDPQISAISRVSAKQIISGAFWIISQIKKEVQMFDYSEFQNLLFKSVPLTEKYEK